MKKFFLIICGIMICLSLAGCEKEGENVSDYMEESNNDVIIDDFENNISELIIPTMEWWELYNPNGFDTFTAVIVNPNDVSVDVSYDIVFYKDDAIVGRIDNCYNEGILPGNKDIIWANVNVPKSVDVDDVRLENIQVTESSYYKPIRGTYEYVGIFDNEACYDFNFESKPEIASIWFVLYVDNNKNNKFDKGEIVVVPSASLTEQTGRVSYDADGYNYTNCDVYFKAY